MKRILVPLLILALLALAGPVSAANASPTVAVAPNPATIATSGNAAVTGCGYRANDSFVIVVNGPGVGTSGTATWNDLFTTGADGCGSGTITWASSGVAGTFTVGIFHASGLLIPTGQALATTAWVINP